MLDLYIDLYIIKDLNRRCGAESYPRRVLDVGCGAGRPLDKLASKYYSKDIEFYGIDKSKNMILAALERGSLDNVVLIQDDILRTVLKDNLFDIVYSTYNTIGSIEPKEREEFIRQKICLAKPEGKILTFSWSQNEFTTEFLKKYYKHIGMGLKEINSEKAETEKGTVYRIHPHKIGKIYNDNSINVISTRDVGKLWTCAIGQK